MQAGGAGVACLALHLPPSADGADLNPKQGRDVSPSPQLARGTAQAGSLTAGCCPQHCSLGLSLAKAAPRDRAVSCQRGRGSGLQLISGLTYTGEPRGVCSGSMPPR